jgi:hypothetical protein
MIFWNWKNESRQPSRTTPTWVSHGRQYITLLQGNKEPGPTEYDKVVDRRDLPSSLSLLSCTLPLGEEARSNWVTYYPLFRVEDKPMRRVIFFSCPHCGTAHQSPPRNAGASLVCDCGEYVVVPWSVEQTKFGGRYGAYRDACLGAVAGYVLSVIFALVNLSSDMEVSKLLSEGVAFFLTGAVEGGVGGVIIGRCYRRRSERLGGPARHRKRNL